MYRKLRKLIKLTINLTSSIKYLNVKNPLLYYNKENVEKNIILISHNAQKAGAPVLLEHMAKQLKNDGYNVVIISRRYGEMIYKFRKVCHTKVCLSNYSINKQIVKFKQLGYKQVICNTVVNGDLIKEIKNHNMKVISLVHELPNVIKELNVEERAVDMVKYSDEIIFPSKFVYRKFCSIVKHEFDHKIKTQGLYLMDKCINSKEESKNIIESTFGYIINSKVILNVATINERKGFDIFVKMATRDPKNIYIWVGDTNCRYYKQYIREGINRIPTNMLLPGYIDDATLLSCFYNLADVFALTSREEPFGTIVLEAFNARTPVVAFKDCGGYTDVVKDNFTGLLVDYESVEGLLKSVNYLLENEDIMNTMSNNCKLLVNEYSFAEYIFYIEELFKNIHDDNLDF